MKELQRQLEIIKSISFTDINRIVRKLYHEDKIELLKMEYFDKFSNEFRSKDLKTMDVWMAHSENIDVELGSDYKIKVVLLEGDSFDGSRITKKWWAEFSTSIKNLKYFGDMINRKFDFYCEGLFRQEEELRKENRIEAIKKELLSWT